jgi:hypothetical protein
MWENVRGSRLIVSRLRDQSRWIRPDSMSGMGMTRKLMTFVALSERSTLGDQRGLNSEATTTEYSLLV